MKILNVLSGTRILDEKTSKYNGTLKVIRDYTWGTYIVAGGLTQSGGIINGIWKGALRKIWREKPEVKNCLILGLGGGTSARLVHANWKEAKIIGVDIDSVIVDLGRKYLRLDESNVKIQIGDALKFVENSKEKFDLILVDLYVGDKFPVEFEREEFVKKIKKITNKNGIVVFNRVLGKDKGKVEKFGDMLEKVFERRENIMPEANLLLICYN